MRSWPGSAPRARLRLVAHLVGAVYQGFGVLLLPFALLALLWGEDPRGFLLGSLLGFALGSLLKLGGRPTLGGDRAQVFAVVALLWLTVPLLGAVPYAVSGGLTPLDAFFEAMSGFTTTGATVLTDFTAFGQSLFLWRAFTQWVGGLGILALFFLVLPQLGVAGRQAFFAEMTGVEKEPFLPKLRQTVGALLRVYLLLTLLAFAAYALLGMPPLEALAHALTTAPAGGFSPEPQSFAAYGPLLQWAATLFMFLAGVNFLLQYRLFFRLEARPLLQDPEFRAYAGVVLVFGLGLALYLLGHGLYPLEASLRHAFFQVVSILTSTGYASTDFALWPVPAQALLVVLMFVGGSAGSGAGGVKVVRWLLLVGLLRREVTQTLHPRAVVPLRLKGRVVEEGVLRQVAVFVFLYTVIFALGALLLALLEGDFVVALTASAQAVGNIGPGLGEVGPMGSYAGLTPWSKLILIFEMWAGRIEILPVVLLLTPRLWRRLSR